MTQTALFVESLNEALRDAVRACGGVKVVAGRLWPEKSPEAAARLLSDCLNEHRAERLCPDQLMLLARMARERGCHVVMQYLCAELSYAPPVPVEPETELAGLLREYLATRKAGDKLEQRIEKLRSVS